MFDAEQYELIDFGDGRKLERFGSHWLDRPSPPADDDLPAATDNTPELRQQWQRATRYDRTSGDSGRWTPSNALSAPWTVRHGEMVFQLRPTKFGHLGIFPEQARNWTEIQRRVGSADRPLKVLNLFAYTGGSTMAAAVAGAAEVVHVDAAKNVVAWARENAELSGLSNAPIRWIGEDARKFAERELKRGNRYDAIILDPPSYGHGPKGEVWKFARDIGPLLLTCHELTKDQRAFVLLTCHSSGFGPPEVQSMATDIFYGSCATPVPVKSMYLETSDGRRLDAGLAALIA